MLPRPACQALTSRYPALAPLVVEGRILLKGVQTRRAEYRLSPAPQEHFPFRVHRHHSVLRRRLGDADPRLQDLKVQNLRRAAEELDGLSLAPGQTFSYWRQVGRPSVRRGFTTGMLISGGKVTEDQGGGLCQMANLLYWMALHSPLTVSEHHHHSLDLFPDSGRVLPFGSGASVFYNYLDLQLRNDTPDSGWTTRRCTANCALTASPAAPTASPKKTTGFTGGAGRCTARTGCFRCRSTAAPGTRCPGGW